MKLNPKRVFLIILPIILIFLIVLAVQINKREKNIPKCIDCNIIFIDLDMLRANQLGIYGYDMDTSPNIDKFAKNSILFKNAYSQGFWSPQSIRSLLTSSLPWFWEERVENNITLPKILKKNGYTTIAFAGDLSFNKTKPEMLKILGFDIIPYSYGSHKLSFLPSPTLKNFNNVFDDSLDWIDKNKDKKNFIYLHAFDLMGQYRGKYKDHFDPGYNESIEDITSQYMDLVLSTNKTQDYNFIDLKRSFFKPEQIYSIIANYDSSILHVDELLGSFLYELNKTGILNKTIIVVFADHGGDLFENGRISHLSTSYNNQHVPLIIYIPKVTSKVIEAPVALMDLMPTILSLVGIKTDIPTQGINLVPIIENPRIADKSRAIVGYGYIIKGEWEMFTYPTIQLYNIKYDPNESINLADKRQDILKKLKDDYSDFIAKSYLQKND